MEPSGDTGSLKAIRGPLQAAEPAWCHAVHPGNSFFFSFKSKQEIYIYIYLFFHVELRQNKSVRPQSMDPRNLLQLRVEACPGTRAGRSGRGWHRPGPEQLAGGREQGCGPALGQRPYSLLLGTKNLREGAAGTAQDAGPLAWGRHNPPSLPAEQPPLLPPPSGGPAWPSALANYCDVAPSAHPLSRGFSGTTPPLFELSLHILRSF